MRRSGYLTRMDKYSYHLFLVLPLLLTCGPAQSVTEEEVRVERSDRDSLRYIVDGAPRLLLGVDLSSLPVSGEEVPHLIEQLRRNGGNYLRLPNLPDEQYRLSGGSVYLDTLARFPVPVVQNARELMEVLLAGQGGATLPVMTPAALNTLRAVRTIERTMDVTTLVRDDARLVGDNRVGALAGSDDLENLLLYIPQAGTVRVRLGSGYHGPRRVSVIGRLGTRRSEVLMPPYDTVVSLQSNDPEGGWMLIQPVRE